MLITSHLAVTLAVAKGVGLESAPELAVALLAGVVVDIDHLFVNKKWMRDVKEFVRYRRTTHGEVSQHSWLQEPLFGLSAALLIGGTLSFFAGVQWWIAPLFLGIHIIMDGVMRYEHQPFAPVSRWRYHGILKSATVSEAVISFVLLIGVIALWF